VRQSAIEMTRLTQMTTQTLDQIRQATNADLSNADPATIIRSICTDSREITPGCLFIALKGDTYDGHDHVKAAIGMGALAAVVQKDCPGELPILKVEDSRKAMGRLARHIRSTLKGKVIAVAGSNGKTGTKNLLHAVLRDSLKGTISPKSFNNDIGVPTTIFAADPQHDYVVLEVGTNHHGEILNLTGIALPDVAIITNIGAEHLEFLGDLEGVRRENAQIIFGLNPDGLLVINGDSDGLEKAVEGYPGKKITFGFGPQNDLRATDVVCQSEGIRFDLQGRSIFIPLMGRHTACNALAAIAVARHLGVTDDKILRGLATATGPEMRLQMQLAGSAKILNDAYNANPSSMQAALETLRDMQTQGRRIAILGDMRELGHVADRYHLEMGRFAAACDLDVLVCIGEKSKLVAAAALEAGMPIEAVHHFEDSINCSAHAGTIVGEGDLVLLKASRGMKLELIAKAIMIAAAGDGLRRAVASRSGRVVRSRPAIRVS
jgi:UDP-N-acetylmuramoyl-tripeptide--D-alanyl-D-alanine ligase